MRILYLIVMGAVSTIYGWITAARLRHKAGKSLGTKVSNAELTSLNTWMRVEEKEEQNRGGKLK